ncbi:MAG: response regulator transcription factor [Lachnospiraceae bacterium]|nr:response regulator transcription factor [Lachnospiraceae bacterium]
MTFVVCDDEEIQRKKISSMIQTIYPDALIMECGRADEAVAMSRTAQVVVMDIDMDNGMDGIEAAKNIYKQGTGYYSLPLIIFVTGYQERMSEAFSVHAFHFMLKPIRKREFETVLREAGFAVSKMLKAAADSKDDIVIKYGRETISVSRSEVRYAESRGRVQVIHTVSGSRLYSGTMAELEKLLGDGFYRIHRSFIVNMDFVQHYDRTEVNLLDGSSLMMSKYKYPGFVKSYVAHISERS